jgi:drug/metabolite transporter (DMT)-like permease
MNSTSQTPDTKFSLGSEPNVRTLYLTLIASAVAAVLITFLFYIWRGGDPSNRWPYVLFVSLLALLGAFVFLRLTKRFVSWRGVALVYFLLFVLVILSQALFGQMTSLGS